MKRLAGIVALVAVGIFAFVWAALEVQDALLGGDGLHVTVTGG
jgi:hypothetical protein